MSGSGEIDFDPFFVFVLVVLAGVFGLGFVGGWVAAPGPLPCADAWVRTRYCYPGPAGCHWEDEGEPMPGRPSGDAGKAVDF